MIGPLAVTIATILGCPDIKVVNKTTTWTEQDQSSLDSAKNRCKIHYEDSPCLITFTKTEESVYRAVCGTPN